MEFLIGIGGLGVLGLLLWGGLKLHRNMVVEQIGEESRKKAVEDLKESKKIDLDVSGMSESDLDSEL